ncbi:leucine-rich repeat protein soc-2 [Nasonia vitripennis]|uniref:Uncharacterized protein n=1 Tax=Nasonia vitripennis TaxID=7425 RepID=A0A7M7IW67_NASVI|nr:leucine-rich repeat protein soc-2 [Nasonia vitripennis]
MLKRNIHTREKHKSATRQELKKEMKLIQNFIEQESKSSLILPLPADVSQLTRELTELEISDKDFDELPELLSLLANLKKLIIHNNTLQSLPNVIGTLENLCIINLSHNRIAELPDEISKLKNLQELDLSFNQLEDLPKAYSKLQRLRILNVSNNNFKCLPKCVQNGMGTLRVLNISENPKVRINVTPYSKYLERFYASGNENCCKFPDWLLKHKFFHLKEFDLNKTKFDVYSFIGNEGKLYYTSISMGCSNLSSPILEMIVENMTNLEIINVGNENQSESGNIFSSIPINTLKNPGLITELNFRATSLSTIPAEIKLLCNLKKLDIGLNVIPWFPEEFCELLKLESLKMDGNDFILFPECFGNLKSLKEIRAENNDLSKLPESFEHLKNLAIIDMYNNKFDEFPKVLDEITNLEGLDFDLNFFSTDDIMIGHMSYSILRRSYISLIQEMSDKNSNFRNSGIKIQPSTDSDSDDNLKAYPSGYSSDDAENNVIISIDVKNDPDDNWESVQDSDDNYKPDDPQDYYHHREGSQKFLPPLPDAFCPADLHSNKIKAEVKSMRIHGSLPSFEIEQGQFDDA